MTRDEIHKRATARAVQVAQDRHRRLHNERIAKEEADWRRADQKAQARRERFRVVRP